MIMGGCRIEMLIYEAFSLKDKRRVVKSILDKVKNRYNVSAAEVGGNENWQTAVIGISTVSNSPFQVNKVLRSVLDFVENDGRVEVTSYHIDMM